jgi:hypothetical protein
MLLITCTGCGTPFDAMLDNSPHWCPGCCIRLGTSTLADYEESGEINRDEPGCYFGFCWDGRNGKLFDPSGYR